MPHATETENMPQTQQNMTEHRAEQCRAAQKTPIRFETSTKTHHIGCSPINLGHKGVDLSLHLCCQTVRVNCHCKSGFHCELAQASYQVLVACFVIGCSDYTQ